MENKPFSATIGRIVNETNETYAALDQYFSLPQHQLYYKPEPNRWNIAEVLEHITLTNHYLMIILDKGVIKALRRIEEPIDCNESDLDILVLVGVHESFVWARPEHMEPTGEADLDEIRELMAKQHRRCLSYLDAMPNGEGVRYKATMTVNQLGKIDMYQWLYFIALHAQRHLQQIEKILADKTVK